MKYLIFFLGLLIITKGLVRESKLSYHASGKGGAVAAEDPSAVRAGMTILRSGGNAADSSVSVMLAASVVDYGMFSIGSGAVYDFDSASGKVKTLSGLEGSIGQGINF